MTYEPTYKEVKAASDAVMEALKGTSGTIKVIRQDAYDIANAVLKAAAKTRNGDGDE